MDLEGSGEFGLGASQEMANENRYRQNKALMTDLRNYEIIFGAPAKTEGLPALEVVEVTLALNALDVLEGTTCSAWGVRTDSPIFLKYSSSLLSPSHLCQGSLLRPLLPGGVQAAQG